MRIGSKKYRFPWVSRNYGLKIHALGVHKTPQPSKRSFRLHRSHKAVIITRYSRGHSHILVSISTNEQQKTHHVKLCSIFLQPCFEALILVTRTHSKYSDVLIASRESHRGALLHSKRQQQPAAPRRDVVSFVVTECQLCEPAKLKASVKEWYHDDSVILWRHR